MRKKRLCKYIAKRKQRQRLIRAVELELLSVRCMASLEAIIKMSGFVRTSYSEIFSENALTERIDKLKKL